MAVVRCGERICLARRSALVATGRGLWSVVTGYLEPAATPEAQAWTELDEELGLRPPGLRLTRALEPVHLTSPASGREFLVHPFLFECEPGYQLALNWENDEAAWVEPARLDEPDCVRWQSPLVRALLESPACSGQSA